MHQSLSINTVIHCPLIRHSTIKEKAPETQGTINYTQILYKNHSPVCFSLKSFSLTSLSIGGGLVDATPAYYSSTQFILQILYLQRRSISQHRPSTTRRSSTVDFLHLQLSKSKFSINLKHHMIWIQHIRIIARLLFCQKNLA